VAVCLAQPEPRRTLSTDPEENREIAESFGTDADRYHRTRPGYPGPLDQVPTFGPNTRLPPDTLRQLLAGLGEVVDGVGGSFTMGYATVVATAARSGPC
jgi:hypothetical protein